MISPGWLAVSGDFDGEVLDAPGAAALTQNVTVQGVTALPLRRQEQTTLLTHIALHVKVAAQRHYTDRLLLARLGDYDLATH